MAHVPPGATETRDFAKGAFVVMAAFFVAGALILLRAWVFTMLWRWFVAPLAFGPIGIAHAIGLMLLVGLLRRKTKEEKPGATQVMNDALNSAGLSALALGLGWIASLCMAA